MAQSHRAGVTGRMARPTPWLVVGVWMSSVLFAFWFFESRMQASFETAVFELVDSDVRVPGIESWFKSKVRTSDRGVQLAQATVVHFYQAGCACNRAIEQRLAGIEERYRTRGVRVVRVERTAPLAADHLDWIDATPAALVFNGAGKLVYLGPYSEAGWCGASGDLVERALDRSLLGAAQPLRRISARGCFCGRIPVETQGPM